MASARVSGSTRTVGLGVQPRLLADLLGRIFADHGLAVTLIGPCGHVREELDQSHIDVAVICGPPPDDVDADTLVQLPEHGLSPDALTEVAVVRPDGRLSVEVADLHALVDLVVDLARSP